MSKSFIPYSGQQRAVTVCNSSWNYCTGWGKLFLNADAHKLLFKEFKLNRHWICSMLWSTIFAFYHIKIDVIQTSLNKGPLMVKFMSLSHHNPDQQISKVIMGNILKQFMKLLMHFYDWMETTGNETHHEQSNQNSSIKLILHLSCVNNKS